MCYIDFTWQLFHEFSLQLIIISIPLCYMLGDRKAALFAFCLAAFYSFSFFFHCDFKLLDPNRVWRYVIWSTIDIVFLLSIAWLVIKNKIEPYQLFIACIIEGVAITAHAMRVIDANAFNYKLTDGFYSELIFMSNLAFVGLAFWPVLHKLVQRKGI